MAVILENRALALWLRATLAAALYALAAFMLALSVPAMGREMTPTTDQDVRAGANFCIILSVLFLGVTAVVSRRWKSALAVCLLHLIITMYVWTQVPSLF
ncbi:hypothetical protein ACFV7Q_21285 [Streptomyces sp. NPDC059851]|uniref:hypothetical protein n=1 Tax=Streptomyces sp. NPDC059851 TaxID=3346971 RepID=UPI00364909F2